MGGKKAKLKKAEKTSRSKLMKTGRGSIDTSVKPKFVAKGPPDSAPAKGPLEIIQDGGLVEWKKNSEAGHVCGILGCTPLKADLKQCPHGCLNHYCSEHQKAHFHTIDPLTGKPQRGPRVEGDKIVVR